VSPVFCIFGDADMSCSNPDTSLLLQSLSDQQCELMVVIAEFDNAESVECRGV